jgi:hypothetical protein
VRLRGMLETGSGFGARRGCGDTRGASEGSAGWRVGEAVARIPPRGEPVPVRWGAGTVAFPPLETRVSERWGKRRSAFPRLETRLP